MAVELNPKHMHCALTHICINPTFPNCSPVHVNKCNVLKPIDLLGSTLCESGRIYYTLGWNGTVRTGSAEQLGWFCREVTWPACQTCSTVQRPLACKCGSAVFQSTRQCVSGTSEWKGAAQNTEDLLLRLSAHYNLCQCTGFCFNAANLQVRARLLQQPSGLIFHAGTGMTWWMLWDQLQRTRIFSFLILSPCTPVISMSTAVLYPRMAPPNSPSFSFCMAAVSAAAAWLK